MIALGTAQRGVAMSMRLVRCAVLATALAAPLGGCFETVGRPPYNHAPTSSQANPCGAAAQSAGATLGYGCPPKG